MTEKEGTFLVTHAGEDDAVLADVTDGQVHTLSANPGVEAGEVLSATLVPDPPLEVTWSVTAVADRWQVAVERVDDPPSARARNLAADVDEGDLATADLEDGELHVLAVPEPEEAAADVVADEATRRRAARLGAGRVEVRTGEGFVGVRYLSG